MISAGNDFNDFPENRLLYSIKAISKILCFVTNLRSMQWSQSWGPKVHGAPNLLIGVMCPLPLAPPLMALAYADDIVLMAPTASLPLQCSNCWQCDEFAAKFVNASKSIL